MYVCNFITKLSRNVFKKDNEQGEKITKNGMDQNKRTCETKA